MSEQSVTVSGRNMQVGDSLTLHIKEQITALSHKYFGRLVTSRVVLSRQPKGPTFHCTIDLTVGKSLHYQSRGTHDNVFTCFNDALEHVAKQLRRQKRVLHEDKPEALKLRSLDQISAPESQTSTMLALPINGQDLSATDLPEQQTRSAIERLYQI